MSSARFSHSQHNPKSTVLAGAGVQDAYWSDDEDEDAECPLCLEEMDVAEMGFKPCPCGYQICMFCYHHIKSNLNGRCPACRREYTEENVQFTAVAKEDVKRQTQQKKRKERERKELEALGRRHFANVRVVQRNVVYVVGLGSRVAKEELIPTLRSNEYFGQYGKISKIILAKRHLPGSKSPVVGLYITYHRREDAARAIHAVDGSPSPGSGGSGEVMRASHGTTKYCMSFLRGQNCSNHSCLDLHEWGDKNDCFTKEDLTTLKHSMKDAENQSRLSARKKGDDHESTGLPRGTSWGQKTAAMPVVQPSTSSRTPRSSGGRSRTQTQGRATTSAADGHARSSARGHDRRAPAHASSSSITSGPAKTASKAQSQGSASSRPTTPAPPPAMRPTSPAVPALARARAQEPPPPRSITPASSVAVDSDLGSADTPLSPMPPSAPTAQVASTSAPSAPPGLPAPPAYQLSMQAQALLDDVRARRVQPHVPSPFPEFDRTLDNLGSGGFSFTWSMDPKIAGPSATPQGAQEYNGSFDPFAASGSGSGTRHFPQLSGPPGIQPPSTPPPQPSNAYRGSFNPFADSDDTLASPSVADSGDGIRQESRFGFARRRTSPSASGSPGRATFASSPLTSSGSPLPYLHTDTQGPWGYPAPALLSPQHASPQTYEYQQHTHVHQSIPAVAPLIASPTFRPQQQHGYVRFQPFESAEPERARRVDADTAVAFGEHVSSPPQHHMFAAPPGLPPRRDSTASAPFHPLQHITELPPRQPSPARAPSHRGSSLSSTPAYASPHLSPASASAFTPPPPPPAPVLLSTDFPALPVTSAPEAPSKREQTQPYILPAPPKVQEPKVPPQPAIPPRKAPSKSTSKDTKPAARTVEATTKPLTTAPVPSKAAKGRKSEKKEETKTAPPSAPSVEPTPPTPVVSSTTVESKKIPKPAPAVKAAPPPPPPEPVQAPLFSKVSKKAKPVQPKVIKIPKEDGSQSKPSPVEYQKEATPPPPPTITSKSSVSEVFQSDAPVTPVLVSEPLSLTDLLDQLARRGLDLSSLAIFNPKTLDPDMQTPLQYDPLVHALSALSVGSGSFANNLPPVSIDSAVSSFQQLLETLTQTISDLLRLLPRTTWDDSSSFDGVLRDMLKGDDFLDDAGEDGGKEDEVAALTLALERRARWMEVQLAKLEELHRDINTAAVRAILTFNDRGWDPTGFMPRAGQTLPKFDSLGLVPDDGGMRVMTLEELQKASEKAKLEEKTARQALQEVMEVVQDFLPYDDED